MDQKAQKNITPNYKRIFEDIIKLKHPEKQSACEKILDKDELSFLDVLKLNTLIFDNHAKKQNTKYRSYDEATILEILNFQKKKQTQQYPSSQSFQNE
ncbi:MAG TPA: hypothetical protein VKX40_01430 [Aequorivita sp.]|nr:hypothetical protein [Aequorivita sp.]